GRIYWPKRAPSLRLRCRSGVGNCRLFVRARLVCSQAGRRSSNSGRRQDRPHLGAGRRAVLSSGGLMPRRRILAAAVAFALSAPVFESYSQSIAPTALPTGGRIVGGQATISQS